MTGSYCMPIGGNCTPVMYQQQDKSKHHLLGSALLGGGAAYGAYKLNLDIVKDSMSASAFEDAIRSGKRIEIPSLTRDERNLLNQARKDATIVKNPEIGRIFSGQENLTFYDFLKERYPGDNINCTQDLEKAIAKREKDTGIEGNSRHSQLEKQDQRRPHIQEIKGQSDELSKIEGQIAELRNKGKDLRENLKLNKTKNLTPGSPEAKNLASDIKSQDRELLSIKRRLGELNSRRSSIANKIEQLMRSANITNDSIGKISGGKYTKIDALKNDLRFNLNDANTSDAATRRTAFFDSYYDSALADHNELLKNRPKIDEKITGMKADLELARAAEAGDGYVTKSMAQEAYQKLGAEVGKGEASIAKAFESLGKKLPKELPSMKKAGLLGGIVALGLYCFNN